MNDNNVINWRGTGTYAPRQEGNAVVFYQTTEAEAYTSGLGTPSQFDSVPDGFEVWDYTAEDGRPRIYQSA